MESGDYQVKKLQNGTYNLQRTLYFCLKKSSKDVFRFGIGKNHDLIGEIFNRKVKEIAAKWSTAKNKTDKYR